MSKPHTIHLPKDYKPWRRKRLGWCKYSNGICLDLELFFARWEEAKRLRVAHKIAKSAGLKPNTLRFAIHRAKNGKLMYCDRRYFERYCNEFEKFKKERKK